MPKFRVYYDRHISTINQEIDMSRDVEMEFDNKPTKKDFLHIEQMLADEFLKLHQKTVKKSKRLLSVNYKVKKVVPIDLR